MINILSYLGVSPHSEVCVWTILGFLRTVFDATLFKVNANLKEVWQMNMPSELSKPLQRMFCTMISGVMLVKCFTLYVYLACYVVLLYPVFLEERAMLVLPWLLLAALRQLLCELTSLALGLSLCMMFGAARPPCVKFITLKIVTIAPSVYIWRLVFDYYHILKAAEAFRIFPTAQSPPDPDYGLELAVRRRRTKSLFNEKQLRKKIVQNFYGEQSEAEQNEPQSYCIEKNISSLTVSDSDKSINDSTTDLPLFQPADSHSNPMLTEATTCEDWFINDVILPRDTDRILEQFVLMLLRIASYMKNGSADSTNIFNNSALGPNRESNMSCSTLRDEETDTPPQVGSSGGSTAAYLRDYPNIFKKNKRLDPSLQLYTNKKFFHRKPQSISNRIQIKIPRQKTVTKSRSKSPCEMIPVENEKSISLKKINKSTGNKIHGIQNGIGVLKPHWYKTVDIKKTDMVSKHESTKLFNKWDYCGNDMMRHTPDQFNRRLPIYNNNNSSLLNIQEDENTHNNMQGYMQSCAGKEGSNIDINIQTSKDDLYYFDIIRNSSMSDCIFTPEPTTSDSYNVYSTDDASSEKQ